MKTREQILSCIEDDMELMGEHRIIYLKEEENCVIDYDYLPSEEYCEAVTLKELQADLRMQEFEEQVSDFASAEGRKLAVVFPGIGYTCEKPLLYYSEHLAKQCGYEIIRVNYSDFPKNVKGDSKKMKESFDLALEQTKEILKDVEWNAYKEILFFSKSIGTVVSSYYAKERQLNVKNILFTPLKETFQFAKMPCVIFHGTADPWAETEEIQRLAKMHQIPIDVVEGANHSLETGNVSRDVEILRNTIKKLQSLITVK